MKIKGLFVSLFLLLCSTTVFAGGINLGAGVFTAVTPYSVLDIAYQHELNDTKEANGGLKAVSVGLDVRYLDSDNTIIALEGGVSLGVYTGTTTYLSLSYGVSAPETVSLSGLLETGYKTSYGYSIGTRYHIPSLEALSIYLEYTKPPFKAAILGVEIEAEASFGMGINYLFNL